jgi:hypothetical protein
MPRWDYQIELNKVIQEIDNEYDLSCHEEECPKEALDKIAKELTKAPPLVRFAGRVQQAQTIAELNRILEQVFDKADECRVWCGL